MKNLEYIVNNGKEKGISTGFIDIDKRTGGLKDSQLTIIAARLAMGKSAFVLNIATYVAEHEKMPVLIFNLEMEKEQIIDRIICSKYLINSQKYRAGKLEEDDRTKLFSGLRELSNFNIFKGKIDLNIEY